MALTISPANIVGGTMTWTSATGDLITFGSNTTTFTGSLSTHSIVTYPPLQRCPKRGMRSMPPKKKRLKTPAIEVYRLDEGSYFVRGTTDPDKVRALLADDEYIQDDAPEDMDWDVVLDVIRTGRFRFVPCPPNGCGEHGWHLSATKKTGSGTFPGVHCEAVARPIEFAIDTVTDDDLAWLDA